MYSQAAFLAVHPSHAQLPDVQSHPEAYAGHNPGVHLVDASLTHRDNTAGRASSAARVPSVKTPCSSSQDKPTVYADRYCSKTEARDKAAEIVASTSAVDNKDRAAIFQAQKLSSWCHVKHSRGETPELSRDEVKALVQVHAHCMQLQRKQLHRCDLHLSLPDTSVLSRLTFHQRIMSLM